MLNYIDPFYTISSTPTGHYQIDVEVRTGPKKEIEEIRRKTLIQEAETDPLFAMAFIHKLAADGDVQALGIRAVYQAYCRFMENPDKDQLKKSCHKILKDQNTDPLAHNFAEYIYVLLNEQGFPPSLNEDRALLNQLIPGLEQTLTMQLPQKIYPEQEVAVPEMEAQHNAFPDLIKYKGDYYACFREASSHVGYNDFGKIRILKGTFDEKTKNWTWKNAGLISKEGIDLRDPRFFVNHKNVLQMIIDGSIIDEEDKTTMMTPHVAYLEKNQWHLAEAIADPSARGQHGQWIWRVTWNPYNNHGYALSYGQNIFLTLLKTADGIKFEKIAEIDCPPLMELSEGTLRFKSDGTAIALIKTRRNGIIGTSLPNDGYVNWSLNVLPFRMGGPDFLISKDEQHMWGGTRYYFLKEDNIVDAATIIGPMDEKSLTPALRLKSDLDTSYPGILSEEDGTATIIYYSSESETKTNIYITRVTLPAYAR